MNKLQEWNAFVVEQYTKGDSVDIRLVIKDYVTRYQRVTSRNVINYVYKKFGDQWRSVEFDNNIVKQLDSLVLCGEINFVSPYYCVVMER